MRRGGAKGKVSKASKGSVREGGIRPKNKNTKLSGEGPRNGLVVEVRNTPTTIYVPFVINNFDFDEFPITGMNIDWGDGENTDISVTHSDFTPILNGFKETNPIPDTTYRLLGTFQDDADNPISTTHPIPNVYYRASDNALLSSQRGQFIVLSPSDDEYNGTQDLTEFSNVRYISPSDLSKMDGTDVAFGRGSSFQTQLTSSDNNNSIYNVSRELAAGGTGLSNRAYNLFWVVEHTYQKPGQYRIYPDESRPNEIDETWNRINWLAINSLRSFTSDRDWKYVVAYPAPKNPVVTDRILNVLSREAIKNIDTSKWVGFPGIMAYQDPNYWRYDTGAWDGALEAERNKFPLSLDVDVSSMRQFYAGGLRRTPDGEADDTNRVYNRQYASVTLKGDAGKLKSVTFLNVIDVTGMTNFAPMQMEDLGDMIAPERPGGLPPCRGLANDWERGIYSWDLSNLNTIGETGSAAFKYLPDDFDYSKIRMPKLKKFNLFGGSTATKFKGVKDWDWIGEDVIDRDLDVKNNSIDRHLQDDDTREYRNREGLNLFLSNGITMGSCFYGASNFNEDISGWDVSKVYNFQQMFSGASSFNQDLSDWDWTGLNNGDRLGVSTGLPTPNYPRDQNPSSHNPLYQIFRGTAMSPENISKVLIKWRDDAYAANLSKGVDVAGGDTAEYLINQELMNSGPWPGSVVESELTSEAVAAMEDLENNFGWEITMPQ